MPTDFFGVDYRTVAVVILTGLGRDANEKCDLRNEKKTQRAHPGSALAARSWRRGRSLPRRGTGDRTAAEGPPCTRGPPPEGGGR